MIEVAPGDGSLKMYMGKLHAKKLQDLPFKPDSTIGWPESVLLREYCFNDLVGTRLLFEAFPEQLAVRKAMGDQNGLNLMSKSDAQIAEAIFKHECSVIGIKPNYPSGMRFKYRPYGWMQFTRLPLLKILGSCEFEITQTGTVKLPEELETFRPSIGKSTYTIGIRGLHSNESNVSYKADGERCLVDFDVASYYPAIMLNGGIEPPQLAGQFYPIYKSWFDDRIAAKKAAQEIDNEIKKLTELLNNLP
jgi:hypothetical protein